MVAGNTALTRSAVLFFACLVAACADEPPQPGAPPDVTPLRQRSTSSLRLTNAEIPPMYRQVLAIDLESVARVAGLNNIDIQEARQRVDASQGQLESAGAAALPAVGPGIALNHLQGVDINNLGVLEAAHFSTVNPALLVRWAINPGQVFFDIIAAKKRLQATEQQDLAIVMQTTSIAAQQYYDLVLAQARVAVAREALAEAQEFLRLATQRYNAQTGLFVDVKRAEALLAGRQQDLALALNGFFQASVTLGTTLYLDPTVTLVPKSRELLTRNLVRDLGIDQLLSIAVSWRPDLQSVSTLVAAADADTKAIIWGAGTPNLGATYQFGGFSSRTEAQAFGLKNQQLSSLTAGWVFNPVVFGEVKTSDAVAKISVLEAKRLLESVKAQVVVAAQDSATNAQLIPVARQQVQAAEESLKITQTNFEAGTGLFLDVLQAQDAVNQARLNHASAITNYNKSQVSLLSALGLIDQMKVAGVLKTASLKPDRRRGKRSKQ
jgi:outer membrane protein